MRIDAHQHFWAVDRGDYGWLTADLAPLYRDFLPADLTPILNTHSIDGTILVQAAPTIAETDYLLSLAERHTFVLGVVGWVDFEAKDAVEQVARLAAHPKCVGLRPMVQDIADVNWLLQDQFSPIFGAMIAQELAFDALTLPKHLSNLLTLCKRYPDLRVVIDHGSKPDIAAGYFDVWAEDMAQIARQTTAFVKLSGLVTEAGPDWTVVNFAPYVNHLLIHFGPSRIIWGSDWPVCNVAASYDDWVRASSDLLAMCTEAEIIEIMGENARSFYQLKGV